MELRSPEAIATRDVALRDCFGFVFASTGRQAILSKKER
jgi:hypothetical protein